MEEDGAGGKIQPSYPTSCQRWRLEEGGVWGGRCERESKEPWTQRSVGEHVGIREGLRGQSLLTVLEGWN